jgi:hypothetical protein
LQLSTFATKSAISGSHSILVATAIGGSPYPITV